MSETSTVQTTIWHTYPVAPTVRNAHGPAAQVRLRDGELWSQEGDARWSVIVCLEGRVWLTQERDWRDYLLTAGDIFVVTQRGRVVASAQGPAVLQVTPPLESAPFAGRMRYFP
jgi:hypothetical protein